MAITTITVLQQLFSLVLQHCWQKS